MSSSPAAAVSATLNVAHFGQQPALMRLLLAAELYPRVAALTPSDHGTAEAFFLDALPVTPAVREAIHHTAGEHNIAPLLRPVILAAVQAVYGLSEDQVHLLFAGDAPVPKSIAELTALVRSVHEGRSPKPALAMRGTFGYAPHAGGRGGRSGGRGRGGNGRGGRGPARGR